MPQVAYVGPMSFPHGGAAARRILGNAQSLREAGWRVVIGSGQMPEKESVFDYQGFQVHSLAERDAEHLPTVLKHLKYLSMGRKTVAWLEQAKPDAVILYSGFAAYFTRLLPWCQRHSVPLTFDCVEWYEPADMPGGKYGPYRWGFELAMRKQAVQAGNIIAITRFLNDYFRANGCRTTRVPPTLDVQQTPARINGSDDTVTIAYTGTPGNKDRLEPLLQAIQSLDPQGKRVKVVTAGFKAETLLKLNLFAGRQSLPENIIVHGPLEQAKAHDLVRQADFSVLLRRNLRYAQAGFATKLVESVSVGTPPLCNLTGDLELYLKNGENALVADDESTESVTQALDRALSLTPAQKDAMRVEARRTAESAFDYRHYVKPLSDLVSGSSPNPA